MASLYTGGDVAHAHAHLVPMVGERDITSRCYVQEQKITFKSTPRAKTQELKETAEKLTEALGQDGTALKLNI